MTQRFYSLAGIRYRFLIPEECSWDTVRTLTDYVAQSGPWDVECVLSISEELSAPEGLQCYHSDLQNGGQYKRYHRYRWPHSNGLFSGYLRTEWYGAEY